MNIVKKISKFVFVILIIICSIVVFQHVRNTNTVELPNKPQDIIRIATLNAHYIRAGVSDGPWSERDWNDRRLSFRSAVDSLDADIVAFQEMETFRRNEEVPNLALNAVLKSNPEYSAGAVGDLDDFPSTQPILYVTDTYNLLDQGWFFFSETPEEIYSDTFNGSFPAFASWVQLQDKTTNKIFRVLNVHTDFASQENRMRSIELVAERIDPWIQNNENVLVVGDFNALAGSELLGMIENVGMTFALISGSTFHFNRGINLFGAIDHVAYSNQFTVLTTPVVIQKKFDDKWPTDHYPVVVDLELK